MVSVAKRLSRTCVMINNVIIYRHKDGLYGNQSQRERLDLMELLVDFLHYENFSEKGIYYKEINRLLEEAKIDGYLCLAL